MTTSDSVIQAGDVGIVIERTIMERSATGVWAAKDVSAASAVVLRVRTPSGTLKNFDAEFTTDGTDGKVRYVTDSSSDLDEAGHWQAQFRLTFAAGLQRTRKFHFDVGEPL